MRKVKVIHKMGPIKLVVLGTALATSGEEIAMSLFTGASSVIGVVAFRLQQQQVALQLPL